MRICRSIIFSNVVWKHNLPSYSDEEVVSNSLWVVFALQTATLRWLLKAELLLDVSRSTERHRFFNALCVAFVATFVEYSYRELSRSLYLFHLSWKAADFERFRCICQSWDIYSPSGLFKVIWCTESLLQLPMWFAKLITVDRCKAGK